MWSVTDILTVAGLVSSVAAYYHVDNANSTVAYAPTGTIWKTFLFPTQNLTLVRGNEEITVDSSKCYDKNYAFANCTIKNNCQIRFPFTGSGVTVYIMHAGFRGVNARLMIDGGLSITATLPPPTPPSYQTPNVSLFNLQELSSAHHTATIDLLEWENGATSLYFDYAVINESHVTLPASQSGDYLSLSSLSATNPAINSLTSASLKSSTAQPVITSSKSSEASSSLVAHTSTAASTVINTGSNSANLGAVVGGTCGGLAALFVVAVTIVFLKKHKRGHVTLAESWRPDPFPATPAFSPVSSSEQPLANKKTRILLAARDVTRNSNAPTGPSTVDPFAHDELVIDCRRDDTVTPPPKSHSQGTKHGNPRSLRF